MSPMCMCVFMYVCIHVCVYSCLCVPAEAPLVLGDGNSTGRILTREPERSLNLFGVPAGNVNLFGVPAGNVNLFGVPAGNVNLYGCI
jgi:hypothetical protein